MKVRKGIGGTDYIQETELIERAVLDAPQTNENRMFFLAGEVGCGKTTYIHHLITKFGPDWFTTQHVWPVKIDLYTRHSEDSVTSIDFVGLFHQHLCELADLSDDPLQLGERHAAFRSILQPPYPVLDKATSIRNFVTAYRQATGRHLLLIVDNLDFLLHRNDMETFCPKGQDEFRNVIVFCRKLVYSFLPGRSVLSRLGANVILALRTDSFEAITIATEELPEASLLIGERVFEIEMPDWQTVLEYRLDLLNWVLSQIATDGVRNVLTRLTETLRLEASSKTARWRMLLGQLRSISSYGLRDLMLYLQHYSWLHGVGPADGGQDHPLTRALEHYPVGLLAFMLQGKKLYSQFHSRIPNMYVVNNLSQILVGEAQLTPSYWLKRLLLHYIHKKSGTMILPEYLIRLFAQGRDGYSESLVKAVLGSMCMASASALIHVVRTSVRDSRIVTITNFEATERGRIFASEICNKMFYLQLIVDDYLLPIPGLILGRFGYAEGLDYAHLVAPGASYAQGVRNMLRLKALQVRQLLVVLDEAFTIEQRVYRPVFEAMADDGVDAGALSIRFADFDEQLRRLLLSVPGAFELDKVCKESESCRGDIRTYLEGFYAR